MSRITIKDIARESGYSIGTVSRVLNNAEGVSPAAKEAVQAVAAKHNYHLNPNAKFLKQKNKDGVLIVIKGTGNHFFTDLADTMIKEFQKAGLSCTRFFFDEEENVVEQAARLCSQRLPQGLVLLGATKEELLESFDAIRIPCVLAATALLELPWKNLSFVATNDTAAAQQALETLFSKGFEHIGVIGDDGAHSSVYKARYYGVQYAFYSRAISFNPNTNFVRTPFSLQGGYEGMMQIIKQMPDADAVFCMTDVQALGAMRAIADLHKDIPEEIALMGFDGSEHNEYLIPRLSSVKQDFEKISAVTVEILADAIEHPALDSWPRCEEIPFQLRMLESTGIESGQGMAVRNLKKTGENTGSA
jgi:LacI family transcriptional regulator